MKAIIQSYLDLFQLVMVILKNIYYKNNYNNFLFFSEQII